MVCCGDVDAGRSNKSERKESRFHGRESANCRLITPIKRGQTDSSLTSTAFLRKFGVRLEAYRPAALETWPCADGSRRFEGRNIFRG